MNSHQKWDIRYLKLALHISTWSKDPSTKVGCVIVDVDRRPVSWGYNGFPKGMDDTPERYADREFKYAHVKHAEENAVLFANRSLEGCVVYLTHPPCGSCLGTLKQKGVSSVVCILPKEDFADRWSVDVVIKLAKEMSIIINTYTEEQILENN